jgi:hypothetical protein
MDLLYRSVMHRAHPFYEASDPNGIRTRVTAVKGRCPGPLDDRVSQSGAISELPLSHARQIARPSCSSFLLFINAKLGNQRRCARGCAVVHAQDFTRVFDEVLPRSGIA